MYPNKPTTDLPFEIYISLFDSTLNAKSIPPIQKKSIHTIGIETNEIKYKVHQLFDDLILENTPLRRAINSPNKKDSTIMYTRR